MKKGRRRHRETSPGLMGPLTCPSPRRATLGHRDPHDTLYLIYLQWSERRYVPRSAARFGRGPRTPNANSGSWGWTATTCTSAAGTRTAFEGNGLTSIWNRTATAATHTHTNPRQDIPTISAMATSMSPGKTATSRTIQHPHPDAHPFPMGSRRRPLPSSRSRRRRRGQITEFRWTMPIFTSVRWIPSWISSEPASRRTSSDAPGAASAVVEGTGWVTCAHGASHSDRSNSGDSRSPRHRDHPVRGTPRTGHTHGRRPARRVHPRSTPAIWSRATSGHGLAPAQTRLTERRSGRARLSRGRTPQPSRTGKRIPSRSWKRIWTTSAAKSGHFAKAPKAGALDVFHTPIQMKKLAGNLCSRCCASLRMRIALRQTPASPHQRLRVRRLLERLQLKREVVRFVLVRGSPGANWES